jgi:two-component system, OmpR family, alkaline phosphatase synthesis response regulator PhoP
MTTPEHAPHLLIVEDETNISDLVRQHFESEGYTCLAVSDGRQALNLVREQPFDVVLLDIMLPNLDGLALCRAIRHAGANKHVPILMLTARHDEQDKLAGFESGADDYLTKPFSMKELTARVGALTRRLRRAPADPLGSAKSIAHGDLELDPARRVVRLAGTPVPVTPHEFRLLYRLASNPGVVFTRDRLLAEIWLGEAFVTERSVDTLVHRLRTKIEGDPGQPTRILTVWGEGYKFSDV